MNRETTEQLRERVLDLLWRQWCAIGVFGHAKAPGRQIIDPEALIAATCWFGRHEPRMFDEMLDWLKTNGDLINTQRLRHLSKKWNFKGQVVFPAVAGFLRQFDKSARWKTLSKTDSNPDIQQLFPSQKANPNAEFSRVDRVFEEYGFYRGPVDLREHSGNFDPLLPACLRMKLRAFIGVNIRAEVLAYLSTHLEGDNPSSMSRKIDCAQRGVQEALTMMVRSGLVHVHNSGRSKTYTISDSLRKTFTKTGSQQVLWASWPVVFRYLEIISSTLDDREFIELSPELRAIELRGEIGQLIDHLRNSEFSVAFSKTVDPRGKEYVDMTICGANRIIDQLYT